MAPLKRRQFGQLAAASFTTTVVAAGLSNKVSAQSAASSQENLYGVSLVASSSARNRENQNPPVKLISGDRTTGKIISETNAAEQSVDNPSSLPKQSRAFFLADYDRVTKVAALGDGNLVISTVSHTRNGHFNHLIFTVGNAKNPQFRARKVLGLSSSNKTIESLLSLPKNQLLCLIGTEGITPFTFGIIDSTTGKVTSGDELALPPLPLTHRFANLCQDPKGNIFATEIGSEGIPVLVSMNLQDKAVVTGKVKIKRLARLSLEGTPFMNDVKDLNFSSSGQLHALATDKSGKNNALFTVDVNTGKMTQVSTFAVEKFTFV